MTRSIRVVNVFDTTPDDLRDILLDPVFVRARARAEDTARLEVREASRTDRRVVQELIADEYSRPLIGIVRSRTERAVITYEWDLIERSCRWRWRGKWGERIRVDGAMWIREAEGRAELTSEFRVDASLPLVGGAIERRVMSEIEADLPRFERTVREHLERRNGKAGQ